MKFNFYTKLTHLAQIFKDETHDTKLDSNWILIWNIIEFSLWFSYYYILVCNPCLCTGIINYNDAIDVTWIIKRWQPKQSFKKKKKKGY